MIFRARAHIGVLGGVLCVPVLLCSFSTSAQALDEKTKLTLAHVVQIESANPADQAAMLEVLKRRHVMQRRGWSLLEQARRYSRPLRRGPRTPRQRRIMAQKSWTDVPESVRKLIESFAAGTLRPVCPGAVHWAAPSVHSPLRRAFCRLPVANYYYLAPIAGEGQ